MNPKTTRILVVLALGLSAFIFFYERKLPDTEQRRQLAERLFPRFEAARATSLEVTRPNQGTLRAEQQNNVWTLTVPFPYPAQSTRIEALLNDVAGLTQHAYISAQELLSRTNGLAEFGLNPPLAKLIVQEDGRAIELVIGAKTLVREQVYLQIVGSEGVFVCDGALLEHLPASANDWRDTALLRLKGLTYNRLAVRTGPRDVEAQLDPLTRLWRLTKPMPVRADSLVLDAFLGEFQRWQIASFVTDNPGADLESFGLQPPEVQFVIGQGTNDLVRVSFGKSPAGNTNLVYALQGSHTNVVLVAADLLDVLRDSFNIFRDRHLISVPTNAIEVIEVRANDEAFSLRRQPDGAWRGIEPAPFPADAALVNEFLAALNNLEIREFVKDVATSFDLSSYGLAKPTRQYVLKTTATNALAAATNSTLAQIDFGAEQSNRVYARRTDENSVYALSPGDRLPRAAFQLRDRRIWQFTTNNVNGFTITLHGQTRKFIRDATRQWTVASGPPGTPVPLALDETLYRFGQLWAERWVARGDDQLARYGFTETAHELSLDLREGDHTRPFIVQFGHFSPRGHPYAAVLLDEQRLIFEVPLALYQPYQELLRELNLLHPPAAP